MAEYSGHFDATSGSPDYDGSQFGRFINIIYTGIAVGYENELEVSQGSGLQVLIDSGGIISKGRYYVQDEPSNGGSPKSLPIDAAASGYLRKDRIVVEFNTTAKINTVKVSKGAGVTWNPVAPALATGTTLWEESLAIVNVDEGSITSIDDGRVMSLTRSYVDTNSIFTAAITTVKIADEAVTNNKIAAESKIGLLASLTTSVKTSIVNAINWIVSKIGNLTTLTTSAKTNLVAAVNEVNANADTAQSSANAAQSSANAAQSSADAANAGLEYKEDELDADQKIHMIRSATEPSTVDANTIVFVPE